MRLDRFFSGPVMVAAGINHFVMPKTYEEIMPEYLPAHRELVYASGVAEALAGAAVMNPRTRRAGALGVIATMIGVFPANLNMALNPDRFKKIPTPLLWARLPLQLVFIRMAWTAMRD